MGIHIWSSVFVLFLLWVYFFVIIVDASRAETICRLPGCNCTIAAAQWKSVNCTLLKNQELDLMQYTIPLETSEIFIDGGQLVKFEAKSLSYLKALTFVNIRDTKELIIGKRSFYNLTSPSLLIRIQGCHHLRILTAAFYNNVQSPLRTEIEQCKIVEMEKPSFGKVSSVNFKDIDNLSLSERTFEFHNGIVGSHGPVTTITFDNVNIMNIPKETFFSTVAEIVIKNSRINDVEKGAFSANQISSILIENSVINTIESDAFSSATLIFSFKISNCTINMIQSRAIMAAITNLTVQHSTITEIQNGAINNTAANIEIIGNHIRAFRSQSMVIQTWNKIYIEQNIIKFLATSFLVAPIHSEIVEMRFMGNEVYTLEQGALNFVPELDDKIFLFKDNLLNQTCHCTIDEWFRELIAANSTSKINKMIENSFCMVTDLISQCFDLPLGAINTLNFTELVCNAKNTIVCEPYKGEVKIVNTTSKIFTSIDPPLMSNWITVIIVGTVILLLLAITSFVIILIRGSRWLKRKGCFRKIQYSQSQNEASNDEENTIETVDESEKQDDLTLELLQNLSQKLDDPNTHQEASEMIEQLYQKYIRNTGNENNNQQENDEAHLYEELGNLQLQHHNSSEILQNDEGKLESGPRSILRLMEEKFNTQFEDIDADGAAVIVDEERVRPTLSEYSEPSDAAIHLYSELKQNLRDIGGAARVAGEGRSDSLKSRTSSNMATRPLPDKPGCSKLG